MWILFGLYEVSEECAPQAYFRGVFQTQNEARQHQREYLGDFIKEVDMHTVYNYDWSNNCDM